TWKFESTPKIAKDSAVTVVMLKNYQTRVPRGECRQYLTQNNRVQKISISRNMTPAEIKAKIVAAFKCTSFKVLECAKGGYLLKAADEELTSQLAIERRGALYLYEAEDSKPLV
ncbi:MAG: hypothetical protein HFP76_01265, partial [Methylococcales symbiont of Iophon sp. n. MRB-2018]